MKVGGARVGGWGLQTQSTTETVHHRSHDFPLITVTSLVLNPTHECDDVIHKRLSDTSEILSGTNCMLQCVVDVHTHPPMVCESSAWGNAHYHNSTENLYP